MAEKWCDVFEFLSYFANFSQFVGLVRYHPWTTLKCRTRTVYVICILVYILSQFFLNMNILGGRSSRSDLGQRGLYFAIVFLMWFINDTLSSVASLLISLLRYKSKIEVIHTLREIDNLMSCTDVLVVFRKSWWIWRVICFTFVLLFKVALDFIAFFAYPSRRVHFFAAMIMKYSVILITAPDFCYLLVIFNILRNYFRIINDELVLIKTQCRRGSLRYGELLSRVKRLYDAHSKLRKVWGIQNSLYGFQIIFLFASFVCKFLSETYNIVLSKNSSKVLWGYNYSDAKLVAVDILFLLQFLESLFFAYYIIKTTVSARDEVRIGSYYSDRIEKCVYAVQEKGLSIFSINRSNNSLHKQKVFAQKV